VAQLSEAAGRAATHGERYAFLCARLVMEAIGYLLFAQIQYRLDASATYAARFDFGINHLISLSFDC
jgi:hypothetical protein